MPSRRWRRCRSFLGRGLRMIASALAPSEIVIVGDITTAWYMFGPIIEAELKQNALSKEPRLRPSFEGNTARLRSAVALGDERKSGLTNKQGKCTVELFQAYCRFEVLRWALTLSAKSVSYSLLRRPLPAAAPSPVEREHVGDAPDDPGPLATDLSAEIKPKAIDAAMKKVGDWQVKVAEPNFNKQWTFAALYDGLLAASKTTGDPKYRDAVLHFAERSDWTLHRQPLSARGRPGLGPGLSRSLPRRQEAGAHGRHQGHRWIASSFVRTIRTSCSGGGAMRSSCRRRCCCACTRSRTTRSISTTWTTSGG